MHPLCLSFQDNKCQSTYLHNRHLSWNDKCTHSCLYNGAASLSCILNIDYRILPCQCHFGMGPAVLGSSLPQHNTTQCTKTRHNITHCNPRLWVLLPAPSQATTALYVTQQLVVNWTDKVSRLLLAAANLYTLNSPREPRSTTHGIRKGKQGGEETHLLGYMA
jgi:hypothetical protein